MKASVNINGCCVHEEVVSHLHAVQYAQVLEVRYMIPMLRLCGVQADVILTEVQSMMNSVGFMPKQEAYDFTHFETIES